jgi:hypothetical protein
MYLKLIFCLVSEILLFGNSVFSGSAMDPPHSIGTSIRFYANTVPDPDPEGGKSSACNVFLHCSGIWNNLFRIISNPIFRTGNAESFIMDLGFECLNINAIFT